MKRPLIIKIFCIGTFLAIVGVLTVAFSNKSSYDVNFEPWYFYTVVSLLVVWLVAVVGIFFMQLWGVALACTILLLHQLVLAVVDAWRLGHLPLILLPYLLFVWLILSGEFQKTQDKV